MESLAKLSPTERKAIEERLVAWNEFLAQGVPPERVGRMVVEAVRANRLYIHTDRSMWDPIWARTRTLAGHASYAGSLDRKFAGRRGLQEIMGALLDWAFGNPNHSSHFPR